MSLSDSRVFAGALLAAAVVLSPQLGGGAVARGQTPAPGIWVARDTGDLQHIQSGAVCPANLAGVDRAKTYEIQEDGTDVACSYSGTGTVVTLYFYISGETLQTAFDSSFAAMAEKIPDAAEAQSGLAADGVLAGALTSIGTDGQKVRSSVAVAEAEGWTLKARITAVETVADDVDASVRAALLAQRARIRASARTP